MKERKTMENYFIEKKEGDKKKTPKRRENPMKN
jgi:hypothetical protein